MKTFGADNLRFLVRNDVIERGQVSVSEVVKKSGGKPSQRVVAFWFVKVVLIILVVYPAAVSLPLEQERLGAGVCVRPAAQQVGEASGSEHGSD